MGSYVGFASCGCVMATAIDALDEPELRQVVADSVRDMILKGYRVERMNESPTMDRCPHVDSDRWIHKTIHTGNGGRIIIGCGSDPCRCPQLTAEDRAQRLAELDADLAVDDWPEVPDDGMTPIERWLS